jgi:hypothetical protein
LCVTCYNALSERRHRGEQTEAAWRRKVHLQFSREDLLRAYEVEGLSLSEIAKRYGCTRQAISAQFRKLRIPTRSMSEARSLSITKGKVRYTRRSDDGGIVSFQLEKHVFNRAFFKKWSCAMAYVLGVIYTDGNLYHSPGSNDFRVSVSQKEPELLIKVRALLGSNARFIHRTKRGISGDLHTLQFSDEEVYHDLCRLGLTPHKSRDVRFPKMPAHMVRHFIRGCWDGDGSVVLGPRGPAGGRASFVSGSMLFVEEMAEALGKLGMPTAKVYHSKRGKGAWSINYSARQCATLAWVLYDGVDEGMYLSRKHTRFQQIAEYYEAKERSGKALEPWRVPLPDSKGVRISPKQEVSPELPEDVEDREEDRQAMDEVWKVREKEWKAGAKRRRAKEGLRFNLPEEQR